MIPIKFSKKTTPLSYKEHIPSSTNEEIGNICKVCNRKSINFALTNCKSVIQLLNQNDILIHNYTDQTYQVD